MQQPCALIRIDVALCVSVCADGRECPARRLLIHLYDILIVAMWRSALRRIPLLDHAPFGSACFASVAHGMRDAIAYRARRQPPICAGI